MKTKKYVWEGRNSCVELGVVPGKKLYCVDKDGVGITDDYVRCSTKNQVKDHEEKLKQLGYKKISYKQFTKYKDFLK